MAGANGAAPNGKSGGSGKKKIDQKKQLKQLIGMAAALIVCAVLITWTVLLMKDRLGQGAELNEQNSTVEYYELSSAEDDPEEATQTAVPEFTEATTTTTTVGSTDSTESGTTTATNATAPKRVTVQSVQFSKVPATATRTVATTVAAGKTQSPKTQTKNNQTTAATERTTQTEPKQVTPDSAPTEAQLPYNELLALYLGAQSQNDEAFFADANGTSPATVVLHGNQAYRVVTPADGCNLGKWLGGTGGTEEHSWQTGTGFRLYQYEDGDRYLYYSSSGDSYQVLGYYDCRTGDNVWARLHYYQVGVGWQAEYHIIHRDGQGGSGTEIYNSTFDAEAVYTISAEFEQQLEKELQARGMSAGNWNNYSEIKPNQQSDALWGKAGTHNNGFAPQSGETYGVVTGSGNVTLYSAANTGSAAAASLPAGTFLSVPKDALPAGGNMVSVQAKVNGTWVSGFIQPEHLAAWYGV